MRVRVSELLDKARSFLLRRKQDYVLVFDQNSIHAARVLADLARFCRANETTFNKDDRAHAVLEGRREVWLRIQHHAKLDLDQLWKVYGREDL